MDRSVASRFHPPLSFLHGLSPEKLIQCLHGGLLHQIVDPLIPGRGPEHQPAAARTRLRNEIPIFPRAALKKINHMLWQNLTRASQEESMRKNDTIHLTADAFGADMEGIGRHDGMAVFVPGQLPGEEADVLIVKVEKKYAFGKMLSSPDPASPDRRPPDCPVFPRCGGCSCRHVNYAAGLEAKRQHVADCFQRIGKMPVEVPPVLGMAHPFAYRNKTSYPVGGTADAPLLGFYAPRSHSLIPVSACPNAMPPANDIAAAFQDWMRRFRLPPYDETSRAGMIRHLVIRVNRSGQAMVTVVAATDSLPHLSALWEAIAPLGAVSLYLNENRIPGNVILSDRFHLLFGEPTLKDTLCGLRFQLSPGAFFQVNPAQTERLYQAAIDFADLSPRETLCDVYCGAGTITLAMARHCKQAIGIEIVPAAVENARRNALENGIANADFHAGRAEELLPKMVSNGLRPDVIVVDPPRKGLDESVIQAIAQAEPSRLVYISCNVATQARDAALLFAHGYRVHRVQPVDMFPFTSHVETVCLLSKIRSAPHIDIDLDMTELDVTKAETKTTYEEIKAYVLEHTGLKVSYLYIAQMKAKHGIIERDCYNKAKTEGSRVPKCPPEKEKAIEEALRHFQMIP